jgi:hypothetical protein
VVSQRRLLDLAEGAFGELVHRLSQKVQAQAICCLVARTGERQAHMKELRGSDTIRRA